MATPTATHRRPNSASATLSLMMCRLVSLFLLSLTCLSSLMTLSNSNLIVSRILTPLEKPFFVPLRTIVGEGAGERLCSNILHKMLRHNERLYRRILIKDRVFLSLIERHISAVIFCYILAKGSAQSTRLITTCTTAVR